MQRFMLLMMLATSAYGVGLGGSGSGGGIDIDTAAQVYQAAEIREQVRATLGSMPERIRQMFSADSATALTDSQLGAISTAAEHGFRIYNFEPPALVALAANMDANSVKKTLAFLNSEAGQHMVVADLALSKLPEASIDKAMNGQLAAPSTPSRDALMVKLAKATRSTESTVNIFLRMGRAVAVGTAIGSGRDPIAADDRARKSSEATRQDMEQNMNDPLRSYMAYGYRDLSDAELKKLLSFLESVAGKSYVNANIEAMGAGFEAMGKRCGEQLGESLRELALAAHQAAMLPSELVKKP